MATAAKKDVNNKQKRKPKGRMLVPIFPLYPGFKTKHIEGKTCERFETLVVDGDIPSFRVYHKDYTETIVGIPYSVIEYK